MKLSKEIRNLRHVFNLGSKKITENILKELQSKTDFNMDSATLIIVKPKELRIDVYT